MGLAFIAALALIYILVVWEFGNFRVPALIMAPIPLTLLGIIPAHALFFQMGWGGEFTATSMIGWIALAGIIVRNSILLVDFSIHAIQDGESVVEAVIGACKTRTRPILITALALVCGSSVIFFDPIFQGMAISLASGVLVATVLTLVVIPLGCVSAAESLCEVAGVDCETENLLPSQTAAQGAHRVEGPSQPLWVRAWGGVVTLIFGLMAVVQVVVGWFVERRERRSAAATTASMQEKMVQPISRGGASSPEDAPVGAAGTDVGESRASVNGDAATQRVSKKIVVRKGAKKKPAKKKTSARKKATVKRSGPARKPEGLGKTEMPNKAVSKKAAKNKTSSPEAATGSAEPHKAAQAEKPLSESTAPQTADDENANGRPRRGIRLKAPDNMSDDGLA